MLRKPETPELDARQMPNRLQKIIMLMIVIVIQRHVSSRCGADRKAGGTRHAFLEAPHEPVFPESNANGSEPGWVPGFAALVPTGLEDSRFSGACILLAQYRGFSLSL
jgi:hypothetical protein